MVCEHFSGWADPCPLDPDNACVEPACPEDIDGSGSVDTIDFLALLAAWGLCD